MKQHPLGFTIVELLVVLVLAGALLTIGFNLLQGLWAEKLTGSANLSLQGVFQEARSLALQEKQIVVVEINLEEQSMGVRKFTPELEPEQDIGTQTLLQGRDNRTQQIREQLLTEKTLNQKPKSKEWYHEPQALVNPIDKIMSIAGIELPGPMVTIRFYPNGDSDSVFLALEGSPQGWLLPPVWAPLQKVKRP